MTQSAVNPADSAEEVSSPAIQGDLLGPRALTNAHEAFEYVGSVLEFSTEFSVIATDHEGVILLWNEGARRLYGYRPSEIIGQSKSLLHTPQDVRADLPRVMMDGAVAHGKWTGAVERVRRDGSEFTARVVMIPRRDSQGRLLGFLLISSDISAEVRMTAQLERSRAYTLAVLEASRLKSEFMRNMSHEIRTPLSGVVMMTDLLRYTALDSVQTEYTDILVDSYRALRDVVDDILDYAKLETKELVLESAAFDLRAAVREVCVPYVQSERGRGLRISHSVDGDVPELVIGDDPRLRQILSNLLANAVKFTDSGEITVRVVGDGGQTVRFEVTDDGIGIEDRDAAGLFDAFVQADGSTTRQYGGTGIGLTIARELVQLMHGEIGAHSREAGGSVFWFTAQLPAGTETDEWIRPDPERLALTLEGTGVVDEAPGPLVLIVEDDPVNRAVAQIILGRRGLRTETAQDGREAVRMAGSNAYDAIFMDCKMPNMDGYEATRRIRAAEHGRRVPIIAMTAGAMSGDRERCLASGMDDYLSKPVQPDALDAGVQRWLSGSGAPEPQT